SGARSGPSPPAGGGKPRTGGAPCFGPGARPGGTTGGPEGGSSNPPFVHEPMSALSNVSRSFATSSAGNAFPGLNGLAIIGRTSESSSVSSNSHATSAPGVRGARPEDGPGYGNSRIAFAANQAAAVAAGAKMPFQLSASAIMLQIVLR